MKQLKRFLVYMLGMLLLALGIILNSKTGLGVAPIVSVAFVVAEVRGLDFASMTMVLYVACFVIEELIKGRRAKWLDVLQLPFCWLMTRFMSVFSAVLPSPEAMPLRLVLLAAAIVFTGSGVALMVSMRIVPNPSDGLVQAASDRWGKSVGLCKNTFDCLCVVITLVIGLVSAGRVIGIGVGTVACVILTGRVVALTMKLWGARLAETAADAPFRILGERSGQKITGGI